MGCRCFAVRFPLSGGRGGLFGGSKGGKGAAVTVAEAGTDDLSAIHRAFGSACYIESSFPAILYFAYKYKGDFEKAVLQNTNVGGENCEC
jgi:hypothetical protein